MLIYYDQSRNVCENKRNMDKMAGEKSDIYGNSTWILQKSSGFDGQFALIVTFGVGSWGILRRKSLPGQAPGAAHVRQDGFCSAGFRPALAFTKNQRQKRQMF
jgi:hypothetical protein